MCTVPCVSGDVVLLAALFKAAAAVALCDDIVFLGSGLTLTPVSMLNTAEVQPGSHVGLTVASRGLKGRVVGPRGKETWSRVRLLIGGTACNLERPPRLSLFSGSRPLT